LRAVFDPEAVLRHLDGHRVEFVLVGGFAGALYGATRPTRDIDIVPRWQEQNLERLCEALRAVDARSASGPPATGGQITPALLDEREMTTWETRLGRVDTLVAIPDAEGMPVPHSELVRRSVFVRIGDLQVEVAGLADIVTSKEFASRAKDRQVLPELHRLLDAAREARPPDDGLSL
jgi:hypothetical protein